MTTPADLTTRPAETGAELPRPHALLVEFLGAFGREVEWFPVAALIELLGAARLDESAVRTSVSRLKKRGWLVAERRAAGSGYRLAEPALAALAAGDRVVWHARERTTLADGWVIVTASIPERERARRNLLRSRLARLGFGNVSGGVWLAPARMREEANALLAELGLLDAVDVFLAHYDGGQGLASLVRRGWDLAALDADYRSFAATAQGVAARWRQAPGSDADALADDLAILNRWRSLAFRDPGLPRELLGGVPVGEPGGEWSGDVAVTRFEELTALLAPGALRHVRAVVAERSA